MFPEENRYLKFIPYATTKALLSTPINILLVYEDDEDGKMEQLVNKYTVDGTLQTNTNTDRKLRSMLKHYSIFYYIIDERKK